MGNVIDFETWYNDSRTFLNLDSWSQETQYMIYECDALLDLNGKWVTSKLDNCDQLIIYQLAIIKAKRLNNPELLAKYRHKLYHYCTAIIGEYCLDDTI